MEVFVLDPEYRRTDVIDLFASCIWTERFKDMGDFELVVHNTPEHKRLLAPGRNLAMNLSSRVMEIKTAVASKNADGQDMLKISGLSLESLFEDRQATRMSGGLTDKKEWAFNARPMQITRDLFTQIVMNGLNSPGDKIPYVLNTSAYPASTIAEPTEIIEHFVKAQSLYSAIKELADAYDFGFRLVRMADDSKLYFDFYTGHNRTGFQSTRDAVIFSGDLDNLQNVTQVSSSAAYKNVAYVMSKNAVAYVYAPGVPVGIGGVDRRVMFVDMTSNDDPAGAALTALLNKTGREALANQQIDAGFDGEISQYGQYQYGVHYGLGDLVEMREDSGAVNIMRVTEQIFAADAEGERSYPSLTTKAYIPPGAWGTWNYTQTWLDFTTETWDTI